jgi:hypothetical protein
LEEYVVRAARKTMADGGICALAAIIFKAWRAGDYDDEEEEEENGLLGSTPLQDSVAKTAKNCHD